MFSPGRLNLELLKDFRIEEWEHHHLFQSVNVTTQSANLVKFHLEENKKRTLQQALHLHGVTPAITPLTVLSRFMGSTSAKLAPTFPRSRSTPLARSSAVRFIGKHLRGREKSNENWARLELCTDFWPVFICLQPALLSCTATYWTLKCILFCPRERDVSFPRLNSI